MKKVMIYTLPECPWCKKAKKYLDEHDVKYKEIDVSEDEEKKQEAIDKAGRFAVPVIEIDDRVMIGYEKEDMNEVFEDG